MIIEKDSYFKNGEDSLLRKEYIDALKYFQRSSIDENIKESRIIESLIGLSIEQKDISSLQRSIIQALNLYKRMQVYDNYKFLLEYIIKLCNVSITQFIEIYYKIDVDLCIKLLLELLQYDTFNGLLHYNLAYLYTFQSGGKLKEVIMHYKLSIKFDKENIDSYLNLAKVYFSQKNANLAILTLKEGLNIRKEASLYNLLGIIYERWGELEKAEDAYEKALEIVKIPDIKASILSNISGVCLVNGDIESAVKLNRESINIFWKEVTSSNLCFISNYDPDLTSKDIFDIHIKNSNDIRNHLKINSPLQENKKISLKKDKLRVGYISGDFCSHAISYFIKPIIQARKHFKTFFYYNSYNDYTKEYDYDDINWRMIKDMNTKKVCELINTDEIDILIDLSGHTCHNRLDILVNKPAPIQISYLGYGSTTGLKEVDYYITDKFCDTDNMRKNYMEKLLYIQPFFMCYSPPLICTNKVGTAITTTYPCIKNKFLTFGSFNSFSKLNDKVIDSWIKILEKTDAKLILKGSFSRNNDRILNRFGKYRERVTILRKTDTLEEHFELYDSIDISLDTFPYNGATTTCESLFCNVPVLTYCEPDKHNGRVTASILKNIKMDEYITFSIEEYISKAVELSKDSSIEKVISDKKRVKQLLLKSPVCNLENFTRNYIDLLESLV